MGTEKIERARVIRRRSATGGCRTRACIARFRMTQRLSSELASIQGLCWRYGKRETLAELFERVAMPAFRAHVRPYADRAKAEREADRRIKAEC